MKIKYVRLYADAAGESHFEDIESELPLVNFAPPAPSLNVSEFLAASGMAFLGAPAEWIGDWHPAQARNMFVVISGAWEVEAADGEVRRFPPGSVLLVEDILGKGHKSRVFGNEETLALLVRLIDH